VRALRSAGWSVEEFIALLREAIMQFGRYTVILEPDREEPHRYNVRVPALPGCLTYGESIDDALANAVEAIRGYVATVVADGAPVPIERYPAVVATISVPLVDVPEVVEQEPVAAGVG
jgi:antitoxin HicB